MAWTKNVFCDDRVYLGSGDISSVSVRPDHAFGVENIYSSNFGLAGGGWGLDANSLEYLEIIRVVYDYHNINC